MQRNNSTSNETAAVLEQWLDDEFWKCNNVQAARSAVATANISGKKAALDSWFDRWIECLTGWINQSLRNYVRLAPTVQSDPVKWAEGHLREFLAHRLGYPMTPVTETQRPNETFNKWLAGGVKVHPTVAIWIAEVSTGETAGIFTSADNDPDGLDASQKEIMRWLDEQWRAPIWLNHLAIRGKSLSARPTARLGKQKTKDVFAGYHYNLWERLEEAIEHSKRRVRVELLVSPDHRRPTKRRSKTEKTETIRQFVHLKGPGYCRAMDQAGMKPKPSWITDGCPSSYLEAYRDPDRRWRKRIQDEKSKIGKRKV
jgi:hypothetical protein